ncbi:MAG: RNA polymerase sporulation sigma factor SigH, partial [Firmicutes bacterium]|nr:RNA polymerase sporulation sigma factor SigH [Bacillota bacterium]
MKNYDYLTDEELFDFIRANDREAMDFLISKYRVMVKSKARTYFIIGGDTEDLIQEGMIGLYNAIRDYDKDKSKFSTFAEICVSRQILTAVKAASRKKHMPLNTYISLNNPVNYDSDDEGASFLDIIKSSSTINPESLIIGEESKNSLIAHIYTSLSKMEKEVLFLYLSGKSYSEIAEITHKNEKSVDNALQR